MNCGCSDRMNLKVGFVGLGILAASTALAFAGQTPAATPAPQTARPVPPTRDPHTAGYVKAKELPDGTVPSPNQDGDFIIGPTHTPAAEMAAQELTHGSVVEFTMSSADSKYYPGIARDKGTFGTPDPNNPAKLVVTTSHPAAYTRKVAVYVPKDYVPGSVVPFIVGADGPDRCSLLRWMG